MSGVIPFAGLAPDNRALRGRGDIRAFDLQTALTIGRELQSGSARAVSTSAIAAALVDAINAFEQDGRAACVLVRAFVTRAYRDLPVELQARVRGCSGAEVEPERACLRLLASRGIEAVLNDEAHAAGPSLVRSGNSAPMPEALERQLRLADPAQPAIGTFHIADASASPAVPEKAFIQAYGVRSVFGFSARAWPGETVLLIAYCRASVDRKLVRALETVALYTRSAWLASQEARAALDPASYARAERDSLAELVALHERNFQESLSEYRSRETAARAEARIAAEKTAGEVERHNSELRRTQRAILNVIDDLRVAREELASQVELRTRELATANRQLELRNRELEEFVYIASHDLQEPLRTVSGYLQMIERRYGAKLSPEADEFIRFAIEGAQRMQALIESLLVYSRVTTAQRHFELVRLEEPFESALHNLALRIEETHAVIERGPLPAISADRMQMVQLFQNLLSNALKFAGERPPRIQVTAQLDGPVCWLAVRDHGIGFPAKFADRIFKVFRRLRRDTEGTGIGLAVCKKIAERHGGRITAESAPGEGATFTVELAVKPEQGAEP